MSTRSTANAISNYPTGTIHGRTQISSRTNSNLSLLTPSPKVRNRLTSYTTTERDSNLRTIGFYYTALSLSRAN